MADERELTTSLTTEPALLEATLETAPIELAATLEEPPELLTSLQDLDPLELTLEEAAELGVTISEQQGLRGPRGFRGEQGDEGPPGRDGAPGGSLKRRSGGPIAGGRAVVALDADFVVTARATFAADAARILGVCMQGASGPGEVIEVVRLGLVQDSSWTLTKGEPVFCGATGELTQAPQTSWAFWRQVGVAVDPTHIFVDLEPPLYLGD